eukprot:gene20211-24195_t
MPGDFAVKVISKKPGALWNRTLEERRREILNEVFVLRKLSSTLNVVHLDSAYEDDEYVYLVLENCDEELLHQIGAAPYTEADVARMMRAVFRTLCQMHENRWIHRDVKPNNFMIRYSQSQKPVYKAIDFGLATPYIPGRPLENVVAAGGSLDSGERMLNDAFSSDSIYGPESDCWAAGVMAYQ